MSRAVFTSVLTVGRHAPAGRKHVGVVGGVQASMEVSGAAALGGSGAAAGAGTGGARGANGGGAGADVVVQAAAESSDEVLESQSSRTLQPSNKRNCNIPVGC